MITGQSLSILPILCHNQDSLLWKYSVTVKGSLLVSTFVGQQELFQRIPVKGDAAQSISFQQPGCPQA